MRRLACFAVFALVSPSMAQTGGLFNWLDRELIRRIQIGGYRQLAFHQHSVSGDQDAFNSLTYYGRGGDRFTDTGAVSFSGRKVLGLFDFDFTLTDNRFQDPQAQRLKLDFAKGPFTVEAGDILGTLLNTNAFASINRNMKGAAVAFKSGKFTAKVLKTETKGSARTVSFQGANSSGPYYLQNSQIISGSQEVLLDGVPLALGTDYSIDYEVGRIDFRGRIIPPTSTVTVTYEAFDFNSSRGDVTGGGMSYDFGKGGRLGVTLIEQKARGNGGLSSRLEQFEGFGAAGTPYFLQFEPLNTAAFPTTIRVDGILQIQGVDYDFDLNNKSVFYFRRFIPTTSLVDVVYFPKPTSLGEGDRRVIGVDYRIPLNRRGYILLSQATGSLDSSVTPLSGTARGAQASYETGGLKIKAALRDVPDDFISVETRGFNRNEKAWDLGATLLKKGFRYSFDHKNASVSTRTGSSLSGNTFEQARETVSRASVARLDGNSRGWSAEHVRTGVQRTANETKLDSTSLNYSHTSGNLSARYGLQNQLGQVTDTSVKKLSMQSVKFDANYSAGKMWQFDWLTSFNRTRFAGDSGTGHDLSLTANFTPSDKLRVKFSAADSRSGQLATLAGFTGSLGTGFGGNGFSSGSLGTAPLSGLSDYRIYHASANWHPSQRLTIDGRIQSIRTAGSVASNTDTLSFGLGADYDLGRGHLISFNLDNSSTRYLDSPFTSRAFNFDGNLAGRFGPKWNYRLGLNALLSGGGTFAQNVISADGYFGYRISDRQNASLRFNLGKSTGYLPQSEGFAGLFYEYQIYRSISLIGSYKYRNVRNLDPFASSGAYRSSGFDLELSFNFGG
ncbi:MAG: hypothetical protein ABL949_00830 [Fimbriimonadaceae bacterium]